jgi:thiamine kinase-like enzyme
LTHGDPVAENLAVENGQLVLFDWNAAGRRPGLWDIAWFVSVNVARLPVSRARVLEVYRAERARLGALPATGAAWERELTLCLFATALWSLWQKTFGLEHPDPAVRRREQAELDFWCAAVIDGQRLL